jgi:hypothetical protein
VNILRMRRHLQKYLPIVLIALMVQIFAPIGACWAAVAASDPLATAEICHDSGTAAGQAGDQTGGEHREHGSACAICCLASASASIDTPTFAAVAYPYRQTARVVWHSQSADLAAFRAGSNAQARAPPSVS